MLIKYTNVTLNHALSIDQSVSQTINPSVLFLKTIPTVLHYLPIVTHAFSISLNAVFLIHFPCPELDEKIT